MLPPSAIIQKGGFSMTEHEKYQEHIRHTHDAFCKTVIRHAAIDAARSIRSRRKREISLEYLIEEKHYPFSTTDKYFAEQSGMTSYPLFVCGQMVLLESPELAAALSALSRIQDDLEKPERTVLPLRNADGCNGRKRNLLPCTKGKGWHGRCSQYALRSLHLSAYLC